MQIQQTSIQGLPPVMKQPWNGVNGGGLTVKPGNQAIKKCLVRSNALADQETEDVHCNPSIDNVPNTIEVAVMRINTVPIMIPIFLSNLQTAQVRKVRMPSDMTDMLIM
jgi:hypothetical protein